MTSDLDKGRHVSEAAVPQHVIDAFERRYGASYDLTRDDHEWRNTWRYKHDHVQSLWAGWRDCYLNHVASHQPAPTDLDKGAPAPDGLEVVGKQYRMRVRDNPTSQWSQWSEWRHGPANVSFMLGDHAEYQEREIIDRAAADAEIAKLRAEMDGLKISAAVPVHILKVAEHAQARVQELEAENARPSDDFVQALTIQLYRHCEIDIDAERLRAAIIAARAALTGSGEGGNG